MKNTVVYKYSFDYGTTQHCIVLDLIYIFVQWFFVTSSIIHTFSTHFTLNMKCIVN